MPHICLSGLWKEVGEAKQTQGEHTNTSEEGLKLGVESSTYTLWGSSAILHHPDIIPNNFYAWMT